MNSEIMAGIIGLLIAVLNTGLWFYFGDIFDKKYLNKVTKTKTALLGILIESKNQLIEKHKNNKTQEEEYNDFITFMKKSKFRGNINIYEKAHYFEEKGEQILRNLGASILAFIIPIGICLFYDSIPYEIFWILFIFFIYNASERFYHKLREFMKMDKFVNKTYNNYVKNKESFGGYDYGD